MVARIRGASGAVRAVLFVVALLVSAAGLFLEAGLPGVVVAVIGVIVAFGAAGVYGVAVQHLGTIALGEALSIVGVVLLETATLFLLAADMPHGRRVETGTLMIPVAVTLAVGTVSISERWGKGVLTASVVLVIVVALGTYLLHRYARVRLGIAARDLER